MVLIAGGCATESSEGGDLSMMQPGQTTQPSQPTAGTQGASAGSKAPVTTAGSGGKSATGTGTTGMAGAKAPGGAAGSGMATATAGSGMSAAAGSAAGASALSGAGAGGAGSAGTTAAAAGSSAAAGASGSAGTPASTSAGSSAAAGSGGSTAAAGTTASAAGTGGSEAAPREDQGEGDGSDVVLIGDSWMSNTLQIEGTGGGIAPSLIRESGQRYRNYGVQGVELLSANTFGAAIPTQWDSAKRINPEIKTVVMTAGGNDVIQGSATLQSSCLMGTDECKQKLVVISEALDKLWTQMADDGVQDIVHIRYTDNTGTLHESLRGDKGLPAPKICSSGRVRCHAVPTTDIVAASDLAVDGIHPLGSANDRIAERTYDLMTKEGMRR